MRVDLDYRQLPPDKFWSFMSLFFKKDFWFYVETCFDCKYIQKTLILSKSNVEECYATWLSVSWYVTSATYPLSWSATRYVTIWVRPSGSVTLYSPPVLCPDLSSSWPKFCPLTSSLTQQTFNHLQQIHHQHGKIVILYNLWLIYIEIIRAFYSKLCWYFKMDFEKIIWMFQFPDAVWESVLSRRSHWRSRGWSGLSHRGHCHYDPHQVRG